jgi:hypothetical protein
MFAVAPAAIVCVGVFTVSAKSSPVPLNAILCGLPTAPSVSVADAARAPPAVGVNVTVIVHVALPASDAPQVFVCAKSPGFVPAKAILVIASAAPPVFVTVTLCVALGEPEIVAANVRVFTESVNAPTVWPVPAKVTECGLPVASSVTTSDAERAPTAPGVIVTLNVQFADAARVAPQVLVSAKSAKFVPVIAMFEIFSVAVPVLVSVAVCTELSVPTVWGANVNTAGRNVTRGAAVPVPLNVADCGLPGASSVTSMDADFAPADVGVNVANTVQEMPGARVAPQVVVPFAKSVEDPASVIAMPEMFTIAGVPFVTVTVIGSDVAFTPTDPKSTTIGDTDTAVWKSSMLVVPSAAATARPAPVAKFPTAN